MGRWNGKAAETDEGLATALNEIAGEHGYVNSRRLGRWIKRYRDRIVKEISFKKAKMRTNGGIHWRKRMETGENEWKLAKTNGNWRKRMETNEKHSILVKTNGKRNTLAK